MKALLIRISVAALTALSAGIVAAEEPAAGGTASPPAAAAPSLSEGPAGRPTVLQVSEDGKQITVPGQAAPAPGARLPLPKVRKTAADKPVVVPAAPVAVVPGAPERSREPARSAVEVAVGSTWLSDSVLETLQTITSPGRKRRDRHPDLAAVGVDAGYRMSLGPTSWIVLRGGVTVPTMPDQNWWSSSGTPRPLYTEISLVAVDIGADYLRRFELTDWLAWTVRGGLGLTVLAGSIHQIETLPVCTDAQAATCAHWRSVGASDVALPPVLPMVRALTGVQVQVTRELGLSLEGGLRLAPYVGGGVNWSF